MRLLPERNFPRSMIARDAAVVGTRAWCDRGIGEARWKVSRVKGDGYGIV